MDGRWRLVVDKNGGLVQDDSPLIDSDRWIPVVPCDDAAIERAVSAFERELGDRAGGDEYLYGVEDDVRAEFLRDMVEAVLRAAGETP